MGTAQISAFRISRAKTTRPPVAAYGSISILLPDVMRSGLSKTSAAAGSILARQRFDPSPNGTVQKIWSPSQSPGSGHCDGPITPNLRKTPHAPVFFNSPESIGVIHQSKAADGHGSNRAGRGIECTCCRATRPGSSPERNPNGSGAAFPQLGRHHKDLRPSVGQGRYTGRAHPIGDPLAVGRETRTAPKIRDPASFAALGRDRIEAAYRRARNGRRCSRRWERKPARDRQPDRSRAGAARPR